MPRFREEAPGHPYGRTALQQELAAVTQAPKGRRNHTLYQAGIRPYSLVAGGVLDHAEVQAGLLAAAHAAQLLTEEPTQTRRTLASAERTGLAHPRGIPTSDQAPRHAPARTSRAQPTDAVTTASAMPEPPAAAKTATTRRRPSRPRRSLAPHDVDHHRLAAAPLLHAIQQRARLRRQSLRELLGPELFGAYGNAQSTGTVRLVTLERCCDEILGWHPRMLYGEAYDQATLPPP